LVVICSSQIYYGDQWEEESSSEKESTLYEQVLNSSAVGGYPTPQVAGIIFAEDLKLSFDYVGDDFPAQMGGQRPKLLHSVGLMAEAVWNVVPNDLGYTGVFESGCDSLLFRLSLGGDPHSVAGGFVPAISLKCLRDGVQSANMFALYSLEGQDNYWNLFAHDLTNHVPNFSPKADPRLVGGAKLFASVSNYTEFIGVSQLAKFDKHGKEFTSPVFPFRLVFHPTTELHNMFVAGTPTPNWWDPYVEALTEPRTMYEIYAVVNPEDTNADFVHIGTIETTTGFTTSTFGDKKLFFQHTRFEDDLVYKPEWAQPASEILEYQSTIDRYTYPDLPWVDSNGDDQSQSGDGNITVPVGTFVAVVVVCGIIVFLFIVLFIAFIVVVSKKNNDSKSESLL